MCTLVCVGGVLYLKVAAWGMSVLGEDIVQRFTYHGFCGFDG